MSPDTQQQRANDRSQGGDADRSDWAYWSESVDDVLSRLDVDPEQGLSESECERRRRTHGRNRLRESERRSTWEILVDQFKSIIIGLLAAAAILSAAFDQAVEAVAIAIAIALNTAIGFFTEMRAVRSMDALREMGRVSARVRRDGKERDIPADELVPGDVVIIGEGDVVTADIRLLEAAKLQANESALTGESVPVTKQVEPVDADASIGERTCALFKGTAITSGSGYGVVAATGMHTELGRISELVEEAESEQTPIERRLDRLGRSLIWVTLGLTAIVAVLGILRGRDTLLMIETAVALAVAAVPEGLPIVATIALARGMLRMARRNALINRLGSVETLGTTSIICTDKTGTLTENRMTLRQINLQFAEHRFEGSDDSKESGEESKEEDAQNTLHEALKIGVLCNNASLHDKDDDDNEEQGTGDPMELALLVAGRDAGLERKQLLDEMPEEREEAFDRETKMMATFHETESGFFEAVKGAPEAVLQASSKIVTKDGEEELTDDGRSEWTEKNDNLAADGLRVLAVARRTVESTDIDPYQDLVFIGLIGLLDPAREDIPEALERCRHAGIRVIMVTGDQPATAVKIADDIGLVRDHDLTAMTGDEIPDDEEQGDKERILATNIFARVSPRQKLTLIGAHQHNGSIVAMTGDGVNDAPALKKADIGIAMGRRGTQVAREAADMVLKDDAFATIVAAVAHGRVIFDNIRNFVLYLLSGNVAEIIAVAAASVSGSPLPLLPLQILFLNFVLDVFPALALGMGEGAPEIMDRPPRSTDEPILARQHWAFIGGFGAVIAVAILLALYVAMSWLGMPHSQAVTVSFLTLSFSRLLHIFNMRDTDSHPLFNEITRNRYVWLALLICLGLLLGAVYMPGISDVLSLQPPGVDGWLTVVVLSLFPLLVGQVYKLIIGHRRKRSRS
ncbi:HAD-IC family P-type ATPase [candidate division GN15 bacterium]|nr:HAD-IC family P-type ATPase [candidate division GN15 bacterium]